MCPLPEGEGSPHAHETFQIRHRNVQSPGPLPPGEGDRQQPTACRRSAAHPFGDSTSQGLRLGLLRLRPSAALRAANANRVLRRRRKQSHLDQLGGRTIMLTHDETPTAVEARDAAFVLGTYGRTAFHPRSGKGARIVDADGHEYWDLLGGIAVNVLGHRHPRLVKALRDESNALLHLSNLYYHPAQGLLAEKLVRASGLVRAFFCNSGTEANEAALKFARLANPGRSGLLALNESFHGPTLPSPPLTPPQP